MKHERKPYKYVAKYVTARGHSEFKARRKSRMGAEGTRTNP